MTSTLVFENETHRVRLENNAYQLGRARRKLRTEQSANKDSIIALLHELPSDSNLTEIARLLKISRQTLHSWIR